MRKTALALLAAAALAQAQRPPGLYAVLHTAAGEITVKLYEKEVPATVRNFVALAEGKKAWRDPATGRMVTRPLYEHITFHRVVRGEMIQAGDPTGTGAHACGVKIADEYLPGLRFDRGGMMAMANQGIPNSGGCQFFITEGPMPQWTGKYAVFGQVISGQDVVVKIGHAPARGDKPVTPVKLERVSIEREGPEPGSKRK